MDRFNDTCTASFLQMLYKWQTAVGSTILAAHTMKASICRLLVRPTGGGKTLLSLQQHQPASNASLYVSVLC